MFIDLKKAFDTVDREILLNKFKLYGINGNALSLLTSYLTNRTQICQINGAVSSKKLVKCSVHLLSLFVSTFVKLNCKLNGHFYSKQRKQDD